MIADPAVAAAAELLAAVLGATVLDPPPPIPLCRRCRRPAAARLIGDPPGPWCRDCRPHRRMDLSRPWAVPRCRYGCRGAAAFYLTPAGGRIGPTCVLHAPPPCHWPREEPTMTDPEVVGLRLDFDQQMHPARVCAACGADQVEQDTGCPECLTVAELGRRADPPLRTVPGVTAADVRDVDTLWRN